MTMNPCWILKSSDPKSWGVPYTLAAWAFTRCIPEERAIAVTAFTGGPTVPAGQFEIGKEKSGFRLIPFYPIPARLSAPRYSLPNANIVDLSTFCT